HNGLYCSPDCLRRDYYSSSLPFAEADGAPAATATTPASSAFGSVPRAAVASGFPTEYLPTPHASPHPSLSSSSLPLGSPPMRHWQVPPPPLESLRLAPPAPPSAAYTPAASLAPFTPSEQTEAMRTAASAQDAGSPPTQWLATSLETLSASPPPPPSCGSFPAFRNRRLLARAMCGSQQQPPMCLASPVADTVAPPELIPGRGRDDDEVAE
ncbi:hypothetical protein HK405_014182, partial [Cladochytrium tenue]